MKKILTTVVLALIVVGGIWILVNKDQIDQAGGISQYVRARLPDTGKSVFEQASYAKQPEPNQRTGPSAQPHHPTNNRIRIASFKLSSAAKDLNPGLAREVIADICLHHDLIAFQEVDGHRPGWLDELIAEISRRTDGKAIYRHASDHVRVARNEAQYAFVYNAATLELVMGHTYTVADPDNILVREPLVGWFRARTVASHEAFTFTVANIQLDRNHPGNEIAYLGNLYDAIRRDGRGEDDIIIVGDFKAGDRALRTTQKRYGMTWVVSDQATNTMNDAQYDNLVFNQMATLEFTGNGGVIDFLKLYNLGFRDAMAISEHMPVWAEFSAREKIN